MWIVDTGSIPRKCSEADSAGPDGFQSGLQVGRAEKVASRRSNSSHIVLTK
jgi:hypothetical protein